MADGNSLADVLQITKDYADENGIAYNELWGSAEAGKAGLAILNGGVEEFNGTMGTMKSDVDDVSSALEKLDTPSAQFNRALNSVKNSGLELGTTILTALAPALENITGVVQSVTTWFSGLSDTQKTVIASIIGVIAVAGPLLSIINTIIGVITTIQTVMGVLLPILGAVSAPVLGIVAAVAVAVAAGIALYKNWDKVKAAATAFAKTVSAKFTAFKTSVVQIFTNIRTSVSNIFNALKSRLDSIVTAIRTGITSKFTAARTAVSSVVSGLRNKVVSTFTALRSRVSSVWNSIRDAIKRPIESAKSTVEKVVSKIKNVFRLNSERFSLASSFLTSRSKEEKSPGASVD